MQLERPDSRLSAATITGTLVYHEITSLTIDPLRVVALEAPILSADGNRAVYTIAPGSSDPNFPNRIFVINADGSEQREIDTYTPLCFCASMIDISADGSKVISSDYVQLRIANADGSDAKTLLTLTSNEFLAIRVSGDGSKVFFLLRRDAGIADSEEGLPVGVYVINPDGSGLRQVVGRQQVADLLGISVDRVALLGNNPLSLSVSHDGSRIAFSAIVDAQSAGGGQQLFGINLDGSGLISLVDRQMFFASAISADGVKVAYHFLGFDGWSEIGIVNFDGTQRRPLVTNNPASPFPTGFPDLFNQRLQLSADGSQSLLGSTGVLLETATGATLQLGAQGGWLSGDPAPVLYDGLYSATMNGSATRFLYLATDTNGRYQLAALDLNPVSLGQAPSIINPTIDPAFVLTEGRSAATFSAQVNASNTLVRVGSVVLRNGLADINVGRSVVLLDDGASGGDATAGDGVFTNNGISTDCCAAVGPRTVRVKAEVHGSDGKRHATAVEFEPFSVLPDPP
jgi:Tol biopolymer transport system component